MGRRTRIIFFTALMFCALNFLLPVIFQSSPAYAAIESNIVLGCPTDSSIKVSVLFTEDIPEEFKIGYGTDSGSGTTYAYTSEAIAASGVTPGIVTLSGLMGNTRYFYRVIYIDSGATSYSDEYSFRTQANAGNEFSFVVQADPHFDPRVMDCSPVTPEKYDNDPDTWIETSNNIVDFYPVDNNRGAGDDTPDYYTNNTPDFFIDLGDTFMLEKVSGKNDYYGYGFTNYPVDGPDIDGNGDGFTYNDVDLTYGYVRNEFFSLASHSVPLFLVTGNHDSEKQTAKVSSHADQVTWAITARRKYYLNPVPDGTFYTGSTEIDSFDSSIRDTWFEWKWGNAQFIVLDPYWYSTDSKYWGLTLGEDQYEWLHTILQEDNPDIKFKFVFLHYLVGGSKDSVGTGRGGKEYAPLYEWGGHDTDPVQSSDIPPDIGSYSFDTNRSGWSHGPIHDMLVAGNVNAVFHGHDHLFVNQVLDDIYYIEVGQAGHGIGTPRPEHYGYMDYIGDAVGSSGYMRVTIDSTEAVLQYVRAVSAADENPSYTGDIDYEFTIEASNPGDPIPGDINRDNSIDLTDLIVSLQIATLANTGTESVSTLADVNNDGKIGIEEAVYILRYCAENF